MALMSTLAGGRTTADRAAVIPLGDFNAAASAARARRQATHTPVAPFLIPATAVAAFFGITRLMRTFCQAAPVLTGQ